MSKVLYVFLIDVDVIRNTKYYINCVKGLMMQKIASFSRLGMCGFFMLNVSIVANILFMGYIYASDQVNDAIHYAQQVGRLDIVSLILALIAVILVLGGAFAFLHIKDDAQRVAKQAATEVAETMTEVHTQKYLSEHLEDMVAARLKFREEAPSGEDSNNMAKRP